VAALFRAPDIALPTLHRLDPRTAPIYEALYRYVTIDDPATRAAEVKPLIAPIFDAIHASPGGQLAPTSRLSSADAVVASDDSFSLFLGVAATNRYERTLPCDALLKRPALLQALGPFFGGAMDAWLPQTDCEVMLPSSLLPVLDQLEQAAYRARPVCPSAPGTIRFTIARMNYRIGLAIRLHIPAGWRPETGTPRPISDTVARFRAEQAALIDRARAELAAYYIRFFKLAPDVAKADSADAVDTLIANTTFFQCGG
jgi:hypothetical protein